MVDKWLTVKSRNCTWLLIRMKITMLISWSGSCSFRFSSILIKLNATLISILSWTWMKWLHVLALLMIPRVRGISPRGWNYLIPNKIPKLPICQDYYLSIWTCKGRGSLILHSIFSWEDCIWGGRNAFWMESIYQWKIFPALHILPCQINHWLCQRLESCLKLPQKSKLDIWYQRLLSWVSECTSKSWESSIFSLPMKFPSLLVDWHSKIV